MPGSLPVLAGLALSTLVSEDLTVLGAALAVREGHLPMWHATMACAAGIFLGDVGLWLCGRLGSPLLGRWRDAEAVAVVTRWLDASPAIAIVASRFLPGARVPMYVAAGAWGRRPRAVILWMAIAAAVWTPFVIALVAAADHGAARVLGTTPATWATRAALALIATAVIVAGRTRAASLQRIDARLQRLCRWEYWPAWLLYLPVVAWVVALAIRHRSLTLFTAANPGLADGGFVGESKATILAMLPRRWTLPFVAVGHGPVAARLAALRTGMASRALRWPLVAKPDVGQRGTAVRWVRSEADAQAYLESVAQRVLFQQAHEGPFEAGLYYVRAPGDARGRLTSITDKRFPSVVGDGTSSLADLVRSHPRHRCQEELFQRRHVDRLADVPAAGTVVLFGRVGNHAQGTEFRDGRALWTPALERRVDAIARAVPGFHIGRFDVRYASVEAFMAGDDLAIVELNGVTAEPTHIYDPDASVVSAWRALVAHWSTAFRFGAQHRARGHQPTPVRRLIGLIGAHLRSQPPAIVSD